MERIIPKNTKVTTTIWKNFTLGDFIVAGICLAIAIMIAYSDIPQRIAFVIVLVVLSCFLYFPTPDDSRLWHFLEAAISFTFAQKKYTGVLAKRLSPYLEIKDDGLIVYPKYYARVVSVGQLEFSILDEEEQNSKISIFENVLRLADCDMSFDIVKIDRPLILDSLSESLFKRIERTEDDAKRKILLARIDQIDNINNLAKVYKPFFYLVFYCDNLDELNVVASRAINYLGSCEIGGDVLNGRETVKFLKYSHTRFFDEREVESLPPEKYIEFITPKNVQFKSRNYTIDGIQAFTLAVADYPVSINNAWGAELFDIDNAKIVLKIRPVERSKATKRLDKAVKEIGSHEDSIKKASEIVASESHMETMVSTLQSLERANETLSDCSLMITAYNNDLENYKTFRRTLRHQLNTYGFGISSLTFRQIPAFFSSNISRIQTLKRLERGITSSSLSAVFPFVSTDVLDCPDGVVLGHDASERFPVALDISKRDGKVYTNSNCLILGKPGSGKSYAAKTIVSNLFANDWRLFIFDVENEFSTLCSSLGGEKIDVGAATQGRINPFHIYGLLTDDGNVASTESVFQNHLLALESFLKITLDGIASDTLEYINNLIVETYNSRCITEKTDCSSLSPDDFPVFDDLMKLIHQKLDNQNKVQSPLNLQNLQRAETYITKFATGGRYSTLWNGFSTLRPDNQLTVFNFQSLLANKNHIVANAQMLLVMRFLEQEVINTRDKNRNREELIRTVILADEAHAFTDPKFPIALDFFYQMAKRIRKYAGSLFFITQNLGDGTATPEVASKTKAIFANCQYSFIFNLAPSDIQSLVLLYSNSGGINYQEQCEITNNPQGTCFLISAPRERVSISFVATPVVENLFIRNDEKKL
jgi:type IV secretory pathway VirB4 component